MDLPRLIVLRIWADPAHFRAVAREPESGQTHSFSDPVALLAYLRAPAASTGPTPPKLVPPAA